MTPSSLHRSVQKRISIRIGRMRTAIRKNSYDGKSIAPICDAPMTRQYFLYAFAITFQTSLTVFNREKLYEQQAHRYGAKSRLICREPESGGIADSRSRLRTVRGKRATGWSGPGRLVQRELGCPAPAADVTFGNGFANPDYPVAS